MSSSQNKRPKRSCMDAALSKLNYSMRTAKELKKSLLSLDYDPEEVDSVIEELKDYRYLDDERYAIEFYKKCRRKNWSLQRILRELNEKGIDRGTAQVMLDEFFESDEFQDTGLEEDERAVALKVGLDMAEKQLAQGKEINDSFLGRVARRLGSLGYDNSTCWFVIGKIRDLRKEDEE